MNLDVDLWWSYWCWINALKYGTTHLLDIERNPFTNLNNSDHQSSTILHKIRLLTFYAYQCSLSHILLQNGISQIFWIIFWVSSMNAWIWHFTFVGTFRYTHSIPTILIALGMSVVSSPCGRSCKLISNHDQHMSFLHSPRLNLFTSQCNKTSDMGAW